MKVGDLVKFTDEHSAKPGFDYTLGWRGLIISEAPRLTIYWSTPHGETIGDWSGQDGPGQMAEEVLEIISEELTDEQLENVMGGMSPQRFDEWRAERSLEGR